MKAIAVLPGKKEVRLIEQAPPTLASPSEAKLRLLEVGVCGTDREICAFEYGTPPARSEHLVIGHESLAEVVEIGPKVSRLKPGDLVVPMVRRPCPHETCRPCRSGHQDFCVTGEFRERGIKEAHGFMTELIVEEERYLNVVPRELRDVAVLVEPLTIAEKGLHQLWNLQERLPWECLHAHTDGRGHCHKGLVLGAGPVGLLGAMALLVSGFETFVYSREPESHWKADLVRSFGARYVSGETHSVDQLAEAVGGIDVVYEAVGSSQLAFEVAQHLASNGVFLFTGVPALKGPSPVDTDRLMRSLVLKNQVLLGTVNASRDIFEAAIRDLATFKTRWPEAVKSLITGRFPADAYRDLLLGKASGVKNVITFS